MKLITEGLLSLLKLANIESTDPRLFKEGTTEYLDDAELTPVLKTIVIDPALRNFEKAKFDEAVRKNLKTVNAAIKAKAGITEDLPNYLDYLERIEESARLKAEAENKQDFSLFTVEDVAKKMPHIARVIESQKQDYAKGFMIQAQEAIKAKEDFMEGQRKAAHRAQVFDLATRQFLAKNPNGLNEADPNAKARQIKRFIETEINPDLIKVQENELFCIGEDGEVITESFLPKTASSILAMWEGGFNAVQKPSGAPPPNGGGVVGGLTEKTRLAIKAYYEGDKSKQLSQILEPLRGTPEHNLASQYYASLVQS